MSTIRWLRTLAVGMALVLTLLSGCGRGPAGQLPEEPVEVSRVRQLPQEESGAQESEPEQPHPPADEEAEQEHGEDGAEALDTLPDLRLEGLRFGICLYDVADPTVLAYKEELERCLVGGGAELFWADGQNSMEDQRNQILTLLSAGLDGVIINLVQPDMAPEITDFCQKIGIPVVYLGRRPADEEMDRWAPEGIRACYVGADDDQAGLIQGALLCNLPDGGDADGDGVLRYALVAGDPALPETQLRSEAVHDMLLSIYPDSQCLHEGVANGNRTVAEAMTQSLLAAHPNLDAILCNSDEMALGALAAIQQAGLTVGRDIYLLGMDATPQAVEAVQAGQLTATVYTGPYNQARTAANMLAAMAEGNTVESRYMEECLPVTHDTAANYDVLR